MKAVAVFSQERDIRLIDHPEPAVPARGEAAARVLETGVCGTDKEIASFGHGEPPPDATHLVLGHESLAEVTSVGSGVTHVEPGDLVVTMVRRPCPHAHCLACREGRQDFCYTGDFTERGIKQAHGFMTEHIVDEARWMVRVPPELRDVGVLVEPLTIAEKALIQVWDVQERLPWECRTAREAGTAPKLRALVLGAGPVGLLGAMTLQVAGFDTFVYSREPRGAPKSQLVEAFGAQYVSAQDYEAEAISRATGHVDLVYEAVGASQLAFRVLAVLAPNAVFVFTGVPGRKAPIEVDADTIMKNLVVHNQVLFGTVNAGRDAFDAAVRDLQTFDRRWPETLRALITGRYPPERHRELLDGRVGGIKNVVSWER